MGTSKGLEDSDSDNIDVGPTNDNPSSKAAAGPRKPGGQRPSVDSRGGSPTRKTGPQEASSGTPSAQAEKAQQQLEGKSGTKSQIPSRANRKDAAHPSASSSQTKENGADESENPAVARTLSV